MKEGGFVVGVDLGGTNVRAGAVDRRGAVLAEAHRPTEVSRGTRRILHNLELVAAEAVRRAEQAGGTLLAVGAGAPGPIDKSTGVIHDAPNIPQWKRFPLRARLGAVFPCPVFVENDANAATLGEGWVGAARGKKDFIMLTLGTGIGGGVVSAGRLVRGARGMAGELGHVVVEAGGPRCNCGGRGCIEAFASATGIKRLLRKRLRGRERLRAYTDARGKIDVALIHRAAEAGDRVARETFRRAGSYLGVAIAGLINIFNPELVVVGGGVAAAWDFLIPAARKEIARQAFPLPARLATIAPAKLGQSAGWLGAAYVAWQALDEPAFGEP